jgi:signal peptidase I
MIPTLLVGDYLFVSKFSYGYSRYSLPWSIGLFDGRVLADQPERGDVVVFKLPSDNKTDYIKRLIGLPGDEIQVRGGILHINGKAVKRQRVQDVILQDYGGYTRQVTEYVETLPNGVKHRIWEQRDDGFEDETPVYTVPADRYFMMGDNRDSSRDSRFADVGFVPFENLIGRAEFLFFSHDDSAGLWEVWKWPAAIRFGRILDAID